MTVWETADPNAHLSSADSPLPPRETTVVDAQESLNFVAFEPGWLPDECAVADVTRRPEQPPGRPGDVAADEYGLSPHSEGNPTSLRVVIAGDGRRLRIKQFLYDWAPPSGSVAPLWGTVDPTPFACGDAVGWLGVDYEGRRGACVQRARTQIELRVLDGSFVDDELTRMLSGLSPAASPTTFRARTAPYHRLNYWVRYGCRPPAVPHGLWDVSLARPYDDCHELSPIALCGGDLPVPVLRPTGEYALDSAVAFGDANAVECVYRRRENGSDHLWLTAAPPESPLAPELPPDPSDQAAETRRAIDRRGTTVHYAALTEAHGAWEALWEERGVRYCLWAGASKYLDGRRFRELVDELAPA